MEGLVHDVEGDRVVLDGAHGEVDTVDGDRVAEVGVVEDQLARDHEVAAVAATDLPQLLDDAGEHYSATPAVFLDRPSSASYPSVAPSSGQIGTPAIRVSSPSRSTASSLSRGACAMRSTPRPAIAEGAPAAPMTTGAITA